MNSQAVETPTMDSTAASSGPITRLPLIITELRATAPARSRRSTSSGTLAWNAGALRALPIPITSEQAISVHSGESRPTRTASTALKMPWMACITIRYGRRGKRSASTPAGIDSTSSGPSCVNTSSPTRAAEPVRSST